MLINIIDFQIDLQHQEGSKMHLSDAISRFNTHHGDDAKSKAKPIADFNIIIHEVGEITGFKSLTLKQIANETGTDVQLEQLKKYIVEGFPKSKHECTELTHDFYDYRESLTIVNGVVLKEKQIVIPMKLRDDAMSTLHRSHMGIVKTKEHASTCMFWECVPSKISIVDPVIEACKAESVKASKSSPVSSNSPPTTAPHVNATKGSKLVPMITVIEQGQAE